MIFNQIETKSNSARITPILSPDYSSILAKITSVLSPNYSSTWPELLEYCDYA